jgi:hypothetical protein
MDSGQGAFVNTVMNLRVYKRWGFLDQMCKYQRHQEDLVPCSYSFRLFNDALSAYLPTQALTFCTTTSPSDSPISVSGSAGTKHLFMHLTLDQGMHLLLLGP